MIRRAMVFGELGVRGLPMVDDPAPMHVTYDGARWEVVQVNVCRRREAIDATSFGDRSCAYVAGPARATVKLRVRTTELELLRVAVAAYKGDGIELDEIVGDLRVRGRLQVMNCAWVMPTIAVDDMLTLDIDAESYGPLTVTRVDEEHELVDAGRRAMRF